MQVFVTVTTLSNIDLLSFFSLPHSAETNLQQAVVRVIFNLHFTNVLTDEVNYYIIRHFTLNLLPHYLAKFECSTYKFTQYIVIQFKSVTNILFLVMSTEVSYSGLCLWQQVQSTILQHVRKISAISTHACFTLSLHATLSVNESWRVVAILWQSCSTCWHDVTRRHRHSEKTIKLRQIYQTEIPASLSF